jgi:hypothetical protein
MKVRDVIKRLKVAGGWPEQKAAIGNLTTRQNLERLRSLAIRQWTFRPEP